jgi:hypothetical protein
MSDYVPGSDPDFNTWQANHLDYLNANLTALGLQQTDLTALLAAQTAWAAAYTAHVAAQASAQGASQTKRAAREAFERLLRAMTQRLQAQPGVSDAHRAGMGISIRETGRTSVGAPETRPVATIDTSQRLRHMINFSDETTPTRRAKPEGVIGCQIWVKVGEAAPIDPSELRFLAMDTATPYMASYDGADGGKVAHYMLRWVNRKGETGPWSQTVSATISG